jgi:hypothetical protein
LGQNTKYRSNLNGQLKLNIAKIQPVLKPMMLTLMPAIFSWADYAFNKQVKAYGYAGYSTFEQSTAEDKQPVVGTGLEFKF